MKRVNFGLVIPLVTSSQTMSVPLLMSLEIVKSTKSVNVVASTKVPISPGKPASWLALGVPMSLGMPKVYSGIPLAVHRTAIGTVGVSLRMHVNTTLSPGQGFS